MSTLAITISYTKKALAKKLVEVQGEDDAIILGVKVAQYAIDHIEEWGDKAAKAIEKTGTHPLSYKEIVDFLEDESLTSEAFYNKCYDACES